MGTRSAIRWLACDEEGPRGSWDPESGRRVGLEIPPLPDRFLWRRCRTRHAMVIVAPMRRE